jgi:hypothetical protein
MKKTLTVILVLLSVSLVRAQVIVAPTILFMSDQSRFGTFIVMNRSNTPQEITIAFRFGFPESDSTGNIRMQYDDSLMAREHSCDPWLRGFPQKFIINPGQQQVVRLLVSAPPSIPDGEYWTRLITSSTPQAKTIDTVRTGITANITFVLQQVTTVVYKKGYANTTVAIPELRTSQDSSSMNLVAKIARGGNSPFFGKMSVSVKDAAGNAVYSSQEILAIYPANMYVKFAVPLSKLRTGRYTAEVTLDSDRNDIPANDLLKVPTLEKDLMFEVQ